MPPLIVQRLFLAAFTAEEIIALIIDNDKGREILDLNLLDRFHSQLFKF